MRTRPVVTVALLAFVVVAVGMVITKNSRRWQEASVISAGATQAQPDSVPVLEPVATAKADHAGSPGDPVEAPTAPVTDVDGGRPVAARPVHDGQPSPERVPRRVVRVTYFHSSTRCISCYKIEALAESAVRATFAEGVATGDVEWRAINVEEPGNEHYIDDYKLFTKSVVVSELVDGQEVRFKILDRVWRLLGDEQAFTRYVVDEVASYVRRS